MTTTYARPAPTAAPDTTWRTRDIVVAAVIGVAFGVVFWAWGLAWGAFDRPALSTLPRPFATSVYAVWLIPAVLAPLIIRKPGAALFAEMVAAGVSALLGSQWGVDTLLSGFVQGAAAELVFAFTLYRIWTSPVLRDRGRRERRRGVGPRLGALLRDVDLGLQLAPEACSWRSPPSCSSPAARSRSSDRSGGPASSRASRTDQRRRLTGLASGALSRPRPRRSPTRGARPASGRRLDVAPGQTLLVVGPSGSGKSTLRARDRRPHPARDPGGGHRLVWTSMARRSPDDGGDAVAAEVGLVFQDPATQLVMERVEDDVAFGLENRGWPSLVMQAPGPGGARRVGSRGLAAAPVETPVGRPAAAARDGRRPGGATRAARARRADGQPRPGRRRRGPRLAAPAATTRARRRSC